MSKVKGETMFIKKMPVIPCRFTITCDCNTEMKQFNSDLYPAYYKYRCPHCGEVVISRNKYPKIEYVKSGAYEVIKIESHHDIKKCEGLKNV